MKSSRQSFLATAAGAAVAALPVAARAADTNAMSATPGAKLVVFYRTPKDQAAFETYYFGTHVGKASKLPGLRSYVVNKSPVYAPDGKPSGTYAFFAELGFDSVDAIKAALASPAGATTVADLANFAQAGADITMMDVKSVLS